jgi:hypothetical protein
MILPQQSPMLTVISPTEGTTVRAGKPFLLQASLTDSAGEPLVDARLTWSLGGVPVGSGWTCWASADPGVTVVELIAYLGDELIAGKRVRITVEGPGRGGDCD